MFKMLILKIVNEDKFLCSILRILLSFEAFSKSVYDLTVLCTVYSVKWRKVKEMPCFSPYVILFLFVEMYSWSYCVICY